MPVTGRCIFHQPAGRKGRFELSDYEFSRVIDARTLGCTGCEDAKGETQSTRGMDQAAAAKHGVPCTSLAINGWFTRGIDGMDRNS